MSGARVSSSPDLMPLLTSSNSDDLSLEGISTNIKLLLKLVQDHQEASHKGIIDERRAQRFGGIMSILEDIKTRVQRSQTAGNRSRAELRRCNTDLRVNHPPKDHKKNEALILDEKERLKRDLHTSYAAQKRLGVMCASLGREKDIISRELTRKVQELNEMEELVSDLRAQNERLSAKIQASVAEHNKKEDRKCSKPSETVYAALHERNKELSDQLLRTLEGYKSMKRRFKEGHEELEGMKAIMEELGEEIEVGILQFQRLKEAQQLEDINEQITALEPFLKRLEDKVSRYRKEGRQ